MTKKRAGRIISGILTICILAQLLMISAVSAKAPDTTENQLKVLSVLGIMDEVPETNVTRGEFAYYAAKMADNVVNDISTVVETISDYKNQIDALGDNIEKLQAVVDECNDTVEWLNQLVDHIHKGGIVND